MEQAVDARAADRWRWGCNRVSRWCEVASSIPNWSPATAGRGQKLRLRYGKRLRRLFPCFDAKKKPTKNQNLLLPWQRELLPAPPAATDGRCAPWGYCLYSEGFFAFVISHRLSVSINKALLKSASTLRSNCWLIPGCLQASSVSAGGCSSSAGTCCWGTWGGLKPPCPPIQASREPPTPGRVVFLVLK